MFAIIRSGAKASVRAAPDLGEALHFVSDAGRGRKGWHNGAKSFRPQALSRRETANGWRPRCVCGWPSMDDGWPLIDDD
jgi:hypothetical protein